MLDSLLDCIRPTLDIAALAGIFTNFKSRVMLKSIEIKEYQSIKEPITLSFENDVPELRKGHSIDSQKMTDAEFLDEVVPLDRRGGT